jgi:hypothetical protein
MLIPQFSIRWLLAVMTLAAIAFSIVGLAVRGSLWAVAVSTAIGSFVLLMLIYSLLFSVVWVFSVAAVPLGGAQRGRSPFRPQSGGSPFGPEPSGGSAAPSGEIAAAPILLDESSPTSDES